MTTILLSEAIDEAGIDLLAQTILDGIDGRPDPSCIVDPAGAA